jgi:exopolysaccharide production protein ExoZ
MTDRIVTLPPHSVATSSPALAKVTFEGVQILRGIAASMVVFHHMSQVISTLHPGHSAIAGYRKLAEVGAGGVDIFFCISGIVIAHAARSMPNGWRAAGTFAWRRLLRVAPPYWIFTAALLALWAVGLGFRGLVVTPGLVVASLLFLPWPKVMEGGSMSYHPILDPGWTLTFEMYFYAACTIVIALAGGRRIWPWALALLAAVAGAVLLTGGASTVAATVLASPLLLEFAAGVALAHFVAGRTSSFGGWALIIAGAAAFIGSIWLPDPISWRVLCWGLPGVALVAGAILLPVKLDSRWLRFLGYLGTTSYTIYLVHPFFTLTSGTLLKKGIGVQIPADALLIVLTLAAILGSSLTYFFVEGPLIQYLKPKSRTAALARETVHS